VEITERKSAGGQRCLDDELWERGYKTGRLIRSVADGSDGAAIRGATRTTADSRGRVSGPFGAAARFGVPPSTLESKIKALKIDKRRFK